MRPTLLHLYGASVAEGVQGPEVWHEAGTRLGTRNEILIYARSVIQPLHLPRTGGELAQNNNINKGRIGIEGALADLMPEGSAPLYMHKHALPNTSFATHWLPPAKEDVTLYMQGREALRAIEHLAPRQVLLHLHGEAETTAEYLPKYYDNETEYIHLMRKRFSNRLVVLLPEIAERYSSAAVVNEIRARIASELPGVHVIQAADLERMDGVHLSVAGYRKLAERVAPYLNIGAVEPSPATQPATQAPAPPRAMAVHISGSLTLQLTPLGDSAFRVEQPGD